MLNLRKHPNPKQSNKRPIDIELYVPVLAKRPHRHLVGPGDREESNRQALGHHGEPDPGSNL